MAFNRRALYISSEVPSFCLPSCLVAARCTPPFLAIPCGYTLTYTPAAPNNYCLAAVSDSSFVRGAVCFSYEHRSIQQVKDLRGQLWVLFRGCGSVFKCRLGMNGRSEGAEIGVNLSVLMLAGQMVLISTAVSQGKLERYRED